MKFEDNISLADKSRIQLLAQRVKARMFSELSDFCSNDAEVEFNMEQIETHFIQFAEQVSAELGIQLLEPELASLGVFDLVFLIEGRMFKMHIDLSQGIYP